jgi:hypothetical protein
MVNSAWAGDVRWVCSRAGWTGTPPQPPPPGSQAACACAASPNPDGRFEHTHSPTRYTVSTARRRDTLKCTCCSEGVGVCELPQLCSLIGTRAQQLARALCCACCTTGKKGLKRSHLIELNFDDVAVATAHGAKVRPHVQLQPVLRADEVREEPPALATATALSVPSCCVVRQLRAGEAVPLTPWTCPGAPTCLSPTVWSACRHYGTAGH